MGIGGAERIVYQLATDLKDELTRFMLRLLVDCGKKTSREWDSTPSDSRRR